LFHNSNIYGSCFIHILYTGCAKIKKIIPVPKGGAKSIMFVGKYEIKKTKAQSGN